MTTDTKNDIQKWSDKAIELTEKDTIHSLSQSAYSRSEVINIIRNHDNDIKVKRSNLISQI